MQTVVQVVCKGRTSLRDAIANDPKVEDYRLYLVHSRRPHRSPGWAKLKSTENQPGAINIEWSGSSHTLTCRVVTKSHKNQYRIVGDFVAYLLERHKRRIATVIVAQVK